MAPGLTSKHEIPQWCDPATIPQWRIAILDKHCAEHWAWMPVFCARVKRFCVAYDSDANGELVTQALQNHFLSDDPQMLAITMVTNGMMNAHLLVSIDRWMGCTVCTILQYEHDAGTTPIPRATLQSVFAWVQAWGRAHGAVRMQCLVRNPKLIKTFAAFYDFHPFSMILTRRIDAKEPV